MRGRGSSVAGNPVLIGAATVLVVMVAVFLAYNANSGLPFVPTYQLKVDVPSGANLVAGNDVRIGGARVGAVSDIGVKTLESGRTIAVLTLKLDKAVQPLPKDSTIIVRPKSLLGLKYVEITRGRSAQGYPDGATVPLSASRPPQVEFDELIDTFDAPTRDAIATNTVGFGTALAGRGEALNEAIGAFKPLLRDLLPVARYLHEPQTGLVPFVRAAGRLAAEVAPVGEQQAGLFVGADRTFSALARVARPYMQEAIAEGPATLDQSIASFRHQRPFLRNSAALMAELRPGMRSLRGAAPVMADALRIGQPTLRRSVALDARLERVLTSLQDFAEDPLVPRGVGDLREGIGTLRPTLEFVAPAQTTCNYLALFVRNIADLLSVGDAAGNWQRFNIIATPDGPNSESGPSSAPANGPTTDNHLHINPYPNTAAPGQPRECEAGNEPYVVGKTTIGNVPGTQKAGTEGKP
jgi:ABC-type transporter Mla subunit MlaD